jgi:hypothetical protein
MPQYIDAYGFILLRVSGAMLCFGCLGFYLENKNADFPVMLRIFGFAFNMLTLRIKPYFSHLGICDNGDHPNDCSFFRPLS